MNVPEKLDDLLDVIDSEDESSPEFRAALQRVVIIANAGSIDAAEAIAEIFAFSPVHRDPATAYMWYHIVLAREGYSTEFANQHDTVEQYCGPVGDFRNEAQVNDLVGELGEKRARELDAAAREWLANHAAV